MEKLEIRAVIKYFFLKGFCTSDIKKELGSTLRDSSPSNTTVKRRIAAFKMGRTITSDEQRSGRPSEVTTPEMIEKIHKIVLADRRVKVIE